MQETDESGIEYRGQAIIRLLSLAERRERELSELMESLSDDEDAAYGSAGEYDAVLRWHCRLDHEAPIR